MSTCSVCQTENTAGKRFCRACGTALRLLCGVCTAELEPDSRFCGECGSPVQLPDTADPATPGLPGAGATSAATAAPALPQPTTPVAERRVCSVLFCDLVGFTPLSESRDPEEIRELLSEYFETARTIVGRYGGVVEKFIGDAVMAVWGTPAASEGDAERCVRAAMDVVSAVEDLGARTNAVGLAARAGVVTGEVAVTLGARAEGMVAGDAVNTAARVQSMAHPGAVWVDDATHRLAAAGIGFAPAGEHMLKGKAAPMSLWAAQRVLSGVGGSQRVDGLEAPLAGRDAELRTLKELFHASVERRSPRLVLVVGPGGVGKSRLGWEFEKYADGLADTVFWHRGRCLSYGDGVVFWALAEIVRQRLGIAEDDSRELASSKLVDGLATYIADSAERDYVGPRLARLLGVPFGGDSDLVLPREELFAGWRVFFERLAAAQPVVLLIENAQHADGGLLDFLDHLVDWAREVPIYVLVFTRPELMDTRPGFGTGRNRSTLRIDPLDDAAMEEVVEALVPGMPGGARARITGRAQGIPLFAVETVRSLVDHDIVVPHEGVYRLVGDLGELSVPDSLHGLLSARLDALDTDLRSLVATAAVIGASFPASAMVAVSTQPEQRVLEGLQELLRREVLSISADPLSPQVGEYRFSQDLLRQVAYETLSRRDRKSLHLAVAEHLRRVFPGDGDEVADAVAHHYLDAMEAVPDAPDVPGIRAEAIAMLTRGGDRAWRSGSTVAAATAYAKAAELTAVPADKHGLLAAAGLYERASRAAQAAADYSVAIGHADTAAGLYRDLGRLRDGARAEAEAGVALLLGGRFKEARERLTPAMEVLAPEPDADTLRAFGALAGLESLAGGADSDRMSAEALELGQALEVGRSDMAQLFSVRGLAHRVGDRHEQAAAAYYHAARLAEAAGDSENRARALLNISDVLMATDPKAAAEAAREAIADARRFGAQGHLMVALINLAGAMVDLGDWDEADRVLDETAELDTMASHMAGCLSAMISALRGQATDPPGLEEMGQSEDPQNRAAVMSTRAHLAAVRGDLPDVIRQTRGILDLVPLLGVRVEFVRWTWPLAVRAAQQLGDRVAEDELLGAIDAHPVGHLAPIIRAERELFLARRDADSDASDAGVAGAAFEGAIANLRRVVSPHNLANGLLDQAAYLFRTKNTADAMPLIGEAREIATRLRAQPLLDRVDLVVGDAAPAGESGLVAER